MQNQSKPKEEQTINPKPPSTLSKETVGVWSGWGNIGNKEVAREAAAKGSHIKLAITFLSLRKDVTITEAEEWFKNEVVSWTRELLNRKQIFKASHVLKNIGRDPASEFANFFYSTADKKLREYIGEHLRKIGKFERFEKLNLFFNLILENDLPEEYYVKLNSLKCLDGQSNTWKTEVATLLFLKTNDNRLEEFLNGHTLWKHLLANSDLDKLLLWISIKYQSHCEDTANENIINQFKKFPITSDMLNLITDEKIKVPIYNELSKYGIFSEDEKNNFILILKRVKDSFNIPNLYQILTKNSTVLSLDNFISLLIEYCSQRQLSTILNTCIKNINITTKSSRDLNLINEFRLLATNLESENSQILLRDNIFNLSKVLSNDTVSYFEENPLILLALCFFGEFNIVDIFSGAKSFTVGNVNLNTCFWNMQNNFSVLNAVCQSKICRNLTVYDLIDCHLGSDWLNFFDFRLKNSELPHFSMSTVVQNHAYLKYVDYKFYLKQSKPSNATKFFILKYLEVFNNIDSDDLKRIEKKVYKLAITQFNCNSVICACIVFIEMIGLDCAKLRVLVKITEILYKAGYSQEALSELILSYDDEPHTIQNILESVLIEYIESNPFLTGSQLIESLKVYSVVVQYSKLTNIKLPELFLKHCASRNLWLPFIIFTQIHKYPLDQIKLMIQFFKSPNMLEHLTHGAVNDIRVDDQNILIQERDSRKYFLSKVGVRKSIEMLNQTPTQSLLSQSSFGSEDSSTSSELFEIDIYNIKATLLQTLIRCHNSTDPPKALLQASQLYRNPLLAILATSYEPDSIITNWLTWLGVSCELCQVFTNYETTAVYANSVTDLLENCLKNRYPRTVLESFEIFIPDNPLKIFMEFLNTCYNLNFNNTSLVLKLQTFHGLLKNTRKNSMYSENDHELTYLNNRIWIEMTALRLLSAFLECNCDSLYEQLLIIENLCKIKMWDYFACECPNFEKIFDILQALYESKTDVRLNMEIFFDSKNSRQAVISCINELLDKHHFDIALKIAKIENLPPDLIIVKEWQHRMTDRSAHNFWAKCDSVLTEHNVTADCVIDFYIDCCDKVPDTSERFTLSKLAWEWAAKYELTCQYELEKRMWVAFLSLDEKHKNLGILNIKPAVFLYKDLMEIMRSIAPYEGELNKDFCCQLERIVSFALNKGNFWLALRLQKMFNCKNTDLETLKLCHSLAEGILLPHQLNTEQRLLLSSVNCWKMYGNRRTFLSTKVSSSSSYSPATSLLNQSDYVDSSINDTLAILKLLTEHLHDGVEIGQNIFMSYRICINVEIPYQVVVATTDYMKTLKDALEDNCMNKLDVVHDFIMVYKWSRHEVADFICEELTNAASRFIQSSIDHLIMWDLNIDQDFGQVLQLLQDNCSILGHKIYSYASALHKSQMESDSSLKALDVALIIELLIRAHDCFTADCNMEGISVILKKSKEVIFNLLVLQDWKLIVRLLTGVARYTEMNYVFQILMENDQFEFLLRKGLKKDNTLKVALLEYLKRFCPDNRDLYKIVALHFTLFSEVAVLWEREAENVIKNLISISKLEMQNNKLNPDEEPFVLFQNTDGTRICLNKAMENYTHATEFHLQGEKLTKAMDSAKQAELLALQLGVLSEVAQGKTTVCLLNLTSAQILSLISSKLSFEQSFILTEAYNFRADWVSVLYEQYIVGNNHLFLEAFLEHFPLTDSLVYDISRKFIMSTVNSVNEIKCMKNILNRLPSLYMKYRIASELGFADLVENLIVSGQLVYLKDTVWKKGYKN